MQGRRGLSAGLMLAACAIACVGLGQLCAGLPVDGAVLVPGGVTNSTEGSEGVVQEVYWNDGARFNWAGGVVLNNQWGKYSANPGYSQAIVKKDDGTAAMWYEWWGDDNNVKAYPAVIFGWHWGYFTAYGQYGLPYQVGAGKSLNIALSAAHRNLAGYQKLNFAWDIWVAHNPNPPVPNYEIMVWPYRIAQYPIGGKVETVSYWGATWDFHSGQMSDGTNSWYVYSFLRTSNTLNVSGNLADFINHVYRKGWIPGSAYVVGAEVGTEVIQGKGEFDIYNYRFDGAR